MDIRREERTATLLMGAYGFLALTSYYVLKPIRNSVFLDRVGADSLPFVYILTAAAVTLLMIIYSRHVDRVRERSLLLGTFGFLALCLVGFWWWLSVAEDSVVASGGFYIWGKLYPLILVSQFYLVGNVLFTTRQARRLFGYIGIGLILGGVAGSAISGWAVSMVGTETLLLVAAGLLAPCAAIVHLLLPRSVRLGVTSGRLVGEISRDAVQLLRRSTHLRTIAWILGLTIIASTLIDWQFNSVAERMIPGEDAKTAFFARFFLGLNIASVVIQVLVTTLILRKFGVGAGMLFLPLVLLVAVGGFVAVPVLATAMFAKGAEGALRYSLDQSTRELLYLPVPAQVKQKVKPLIDLAVYRGGTGLAGLLLMLVVNVPGLPWEATVRVVAGLTVVCIALWIRVTFRMRNEFRQSIRDLIGVRDADLDELVGPQLGEETWEAVGRALGEEQEKRVLFALGLLERYPEQELAPAVEKLRDHPSLEVRRRAAVLLQAMSDRRLADHRRAPLRDPALDVQLEAVSLLWSARKANGHSPRVAMDTSRHLDGERLTPRPPTASQTPWAAPENIFLPGPLADDKSGAAAGADALLRALPAMDATRRYDALKQLGRLRHRRTDVQFADGDIEVALAGELRSGYRWAAFEKVVAGSGSPQRPAVRLLATALRQRRHEAAERASRILGLRYSPEDLFVAFTALQSPDPLTRQNGSELLESTLKRRHRATLGPLLDPDRAVAELAAIAEKEYGLDPGAPRKALGTLAADRSDDWIATLAGAALDGMQVTGDGFDPGSASSSTPGSAPLSMWGGRGASSALVSTATAPIQGQEIMDVIERAELLGSTYLLETVRTEDLAELALIVAERSYSDGEVLFEEGQTMSTELYVIAEGEVAASNRSGRTLFTARRGETLGDLAFLDGLPQPYRAAAVGDSRALVISRDDFQQFLRERFTVVEALLARLGRTVRQLDRRLADPPSEITRPEPR